VTLRSFQIHADPDAWHRIGLTVAGDGRTRIGACELHLVDAQPRGIVSWTLTGDQTGHRVLDGLDTHVVFDDTAGDGEGGEAVTHLLRVTLIDHVVIMTPSLERTCGAITEATGVPLKRIREVGRGVRQGFHRLGEVIVEVVERPDIPAETPACFWGLVLIVDDLPAAAERLGPSVLGPVKSAVQPGRLISTVRDEVGLGLPVALMSA
jgi:hypothetical protein